MYIYVFLSNREKVRNKSYSYIHDGIFLNSRLSIAVKNMPRDSVGVVAFWLERMRTVMVTGCSSTTLFN